MSQPLVVVTSDAFEHNMLAFSGGPASYMNALALAGLLPVQLPTIAEPIDPSALLDVASGVLVTGARSNVHPAQYGVEETEEAAPFDHLRDRTTLPLIRAAIDRGIPLFCICRGIQEMNVALGGTLFIAVHDVPGRDDHRSTPQADTDVWFGLKHNVKVDEGGLLADILGAGPVHVNSVHRQAIDKVAPGLRVEAHAYDGTVEAISVPTVPFALGVQWHPEHFVRTDGPSRAVFDAFADAARAYAARKSRKVAA